MKNMKRQADLKGGIIVPLTVPDGTKSGDIIALSATLYGIAGTDGVTADAFKKGEHPQGLKQGQASVLLPGVAYSFEAPAADLAGVALFAPIYWTNATKKYGAAGDVKVGWKIGASEIGARANQ